MPEISAGHLHYVFKVSLRRFGVFARASTGGRFLQPMARSPDYLPQPQRARRCWVSGPPYEESHE